METGVIIDFVVVVVLVLALIDGWRHGFFGSLLSVIGISAGLILGFALVPFVISYVDDNQVRLAVAVGLLILVAAAGHIIGGTAGASLRDKVARTKMRGLDSVAGAVFHTAMVVFVVWLVATPLAEGTSRLAHGVRNSELLQQVDKHSPSFLAQMPDKLRLLLNDSGVPAISSPFQSPETGTVAAPRIEVDNTAMVERVRPSVVHIIGEAQQCQRRLMGSGFVVANDRIMTNAHVVAGTNEVDIDTVLGIHTAQVVYYNADEDIAILAADGLGLEPLQWAEQPAVSGDDAVVMGFPESGPFEAAPARIINSMVINSPSIYADKRVDREAYSVRGSIRQGNSGGPLLTSDGKVLGLVFGAAADHTDTGYALTRAEVENYVPDARTFGEPVQTGECIIG